ncbi:rare lipoprotein A [Clostridium acetobutylicum]|uniref:Rare lipoprotein A RLPA releated protein n=1 Tax=Clostridium acetobutylicum (strain ATCC 824 / DSM 792 / JCM 1419 / IAM 19013 / LMG 5710 / NBRC 13948 / NRRL B-527 / VKM B-1787 / 2291 / W) TaxID=272562 RepID=Q97TP0_CLOAB|nr:MULTISPECIES: septal ring lytic transglycosylase RlpA family protein [Clostridium]AAK76804.1 Rare lipoprotein A RLPA releated protein [Clostridium acetobutylicum ATCC 824]ADZ22840.1 Rare lipoprotein A RLPA releated protein [Clostridium acetobutylicum EA 2018]AEI34800.1 rare lipoprotein A RLPA releated protein [Clostridium acetobutylicum DSM 1731]AWV82349.1 septal ring lytic transglycosylase RlpA family protein [Clostridium acetobutylicum]MBC2395808.1 septal ring lytic transglycosylase RlpA 
MKKAKSFVCLMTLLCVAQSTSVFAKNLDTKKVPSHMTPGTVIQYNSNKQMKVVKQGAVKNTLKASAKVNTTASTDLPEIKSNMTVVYDALGAPVVVGNSSAAKSVQANKVLKASDSNEEQGYVSWYDIWSGGTASGDQASDGAAHKTLPFYTQVSVYNENNNWASTSVRILDRGPYVSGRILDMSQESFSKVANTDDGVFYGAIYW